MWISRDFQTISAMWQEIAPTFGCMETENTETWIEQAIKVWVSPPVPVGSQINPHIKSQVKPII